MPHPARSTKSPFSVSLYATPARGAMFENVVDHASVPTGARARFAGLLAFSHDANVVVPRPVGAGLSSHRKPYVRVSRGVIFQLSWPYRENACVNSLEDFLVVADSVPSAVVRRFCTLAELNRNDSVDGAASRNMVRSSEPNRS